MGWIDDLIEDSVDVLGEAADMGVGVATGAASTAGGVTETGINVGGDLIGGAASVAGAAPGIVGDALLGGVEVPQGLADKIRLQKEAEQRRADAVTPSQIDIARKNLTHSQGNNFLSTHLSDDQIRTMIARNPSLTTQFTPAQIDQARKTIMDGTNMPGWAQPTDKQILTLLLQSPPDKARALTTPISDSEYESYRDRHGLSGGASVSAQQIIEDRVKIVAVAGKGAAGGQLSPDELEQYSQSMAGQNAQFVKEQAEKAKVLLGDTNQDGKLSATEGNALIGRLDINHDGYVTRTELGSQFDELTTTKPLQGTTIDGTRTHVYTDEQVARLTFQKELDHLNSGAPLTPAEQARKEQLTNFFTAMSDPVQRAQFTQMAGATEAIKAMSASGGKPLTDQQAWDAAAHMTPEQRDQITKVAQPIIKIQGAVDDVNDRIHIEQNLAPIANGNTKKGLDEKLLKVAKTGGTIKSMDDITTPYVTPGTMGQTKKFTSGDIKKLTNEIKASSKANDKTFTPTRLLPTEQTGSTEKFGKTIGVTVNKLAEDSKTVPSTPRSVGQKIAENINGKGIHDTLGIDVIPAKPAPSAPKNILQQPDRINPNRPAVPAGSTELRGTVASKVGQRIAQTVTTKKPTSSAMGGSLGSSVKKTVSEFPPVTTTKFSSDVKLTSSRTKSGIM